MPSHVYTEVDVALVGDGKRVWASFGGESGSEMTIDVFAEKFVRNFTFDSRYEVDTDDGLEPPANPILACFVSSGGDARDNHCIYAYELERRGGYNWPLGGPDSDNGWSVTVPFWISDEGERMALTAMAWLLLAEAENRRGQRDDG